MPASRSRSTLSHRRKDSWSVFPQKVRAKAFWEGERRFTVSLAAGRHRPEAGRGGASPPANSATARSSRPPLAIVWTLPASGLADKSEQPSRSALTGQSNRPAAGAGDGLNAIHPVLLRRHYRALRPRRQWPLD